MSSQSTHGGDNASDTPDPEKRRYRVLKDIEPALETVAATDGPFASNAQNALDDLEALREQYGDEVGGDD